MLSGVAALALGGIFSILLVLARSSHVQAYIPFKRFFHTALVVHVDLSVLLWFLLAASLVWFLASGSRVTMLTKAALWCFWAGMVIMAITPFTGDAHPIINNYVPVLQHPLFFVALGFVLAGLLFQACHALWWVRWWKSSAAMERAVQFGVWSSALIALTAALALVASHLLLPADVVGEMYYEALFWGGGHMLQFTHTHLLMVVWLWLLVHMDGERTLPPTLLTALWGFGLLVVLGGIWPYLDGVVHDYAFHRFFTLQMAFFNGSYVIPVGLIVAWELWQGKAKSTSGADRVVYNSLLASFLLFAAGGMISLFIEGTNVIIPAHYHGSIVGVSLAYMGLFYLLLPKLGMAAAESRAARWQPLLYGGGQLLHILGLFVSGGYDVARKTTESYEGITGAQIGMGMMGLGGLIAIIGGVMFVVIIFRCWRASVV